MKKIDYGVDAPKVIRALFIISIILFSNVAIAPRLHLGDITISIVLFDITCASICWLFAFLMLLYAKKGKYKHRDRILNLINWKSNETVLDIGTGLGLLMIGAAKHLTNGKSIGIDIWNKKDLSKNSSDKARLNAELEGVADKIEIKDENIIQTSFQDNYFDVVLSNLCLHNIKEKEERKKALIEIHRILKKDGISIISDFKNIKEYKRGFLKLGMDVEIKGTYYLSTFPPLTIIKAVKK